MQYIILDGKSPTHKFKDGEGTKTWEEAKDFDNVAVIVPKGYVVLDFDTESDAEIMLKITEALDLKTRVMKTTRGLHFWFKSPEDEPKNFIKNRLAVGIYCDRKAGGRNAYVKIKQDGKARKWVRKIKSNEIEVLPKWLTSVSAPSGKFAFKEMGEGSGRNQELFNYIVYLQTKGFNRDEIRQTIEIINDYVLAEPLPDSEVATITRDEAFKSDEEIAEQIEKAEKKAGFNHVEIAEELINEHNLINYNGVIYEYLDGYYQRCEYLGKYCREKVFGIKTTQRNEIVNYIQDMKKILKSDISVNPYIINCKNTRLDIRNGKCLEFDPSVIEFLRLPVVYDPSAYCADLDKMLNRVFCGDREVINLFEEMLGYGLMGHAKFAKIFLFCGNGSNGKSTVLDLLRTFAGFENCSSLGINETTSTFGKIELENKFFNIGDDIDKEVIKDTGTLKRISAGNAVTVENKGEKKYSTTLTTTLIYSANEIPRSFDKTDGFYRRWLIIPFNATFSADDEDYDPMIEEKISTPEALSYMLNMALRGAKRLLKQGHFTEPKVVIEELNKYKVENSTVLSWLEDKNLNEDYLLDNPRDMLYSEFVDWCKLAGIKPNMITGKKTFFKEVADKYDFDDKSKQKSDGKRYFRVKI